jgi:hypothetical protein
MKSGKILKRTIKNLFHCQKVHSNILFEDEKLPQKLYSFMKKVGRFAKNFAKKKMALHLTTFFSLEK